MSFNVLPFGSRPPADEEPRLGAAAEVVDLSRWRASDVGLPELPETLLADIDAAATRAEDLRVDNLEVRFDTDPDSGRVAASLCDRGGDVVRELPLREAVGYDDDGPQSAA